MPISGETRMTDELFGGSRLVTLIGTVVGALCVGAIWGYLSESMGFRVSIFIRYILFATCSYLIVGLLLLRRTGNPRRRIPGSMRIAVLGSMVFVLSMYLVYAFPDVWKFRSTEASVFNYYLTEVKDLGMALVLHTIIDSLIVLLVLGLVSHIASIIVGVIRRNDYA
jgi:MFS family permease